jgi:hypothetical protein
LTDKEHELLSEKIKQHTKEVSEDPEKARKFLMETGMYTKEGKLKKHLR